MALARRARWRGAKAPSVLLFQPRGGQGERQSPHPGDPAQQVATLRVDDA
jgi:hypothetical protein